MYSYILCIPVRNNLFLLLIWKRLLWSACHNICTYGKGKAIPLQAWRVPGGWRSQISRQLAHEDGKVVSITHRPSLPPRKYSWYSFLLEADSTPGPQCGRKDYVSENLQYLYLRRLYICIYIYTYVYIHPAQHFTLSCLRYDINVDSYHKKI